MDLTGRLAMCPWLENLKRTRHEWIRSSTASAIGRLWGGLLGKPAHACANTQNPPGVRPHPTYP